MVNVIVKTNMPCIYSVTAFNSDIGHVKQLKLIRNLPCIYFQVFHDVIS